MFQILDLITPENQADAYTWAAVLLAHATVGLVLTAAVAMVLDWLGEVHTGALAWGMVAAIVSRVLDLIRTVDAGLLAFAVVTVGYALAWEGVVQGYGAGLGDAAVDTFAVAAGGALGVLAWQHRAPALMAAVLSLAAVLWAGVRVRK